MGGRRPVHSLHRANSGMGLDSVTYRLTESVIYKVRKSVNL